MKNYVLISMIVALFVSCQFNHPDEQKSKPATDSLQGIAKEVLQTSSYTYILLDINGKDTWIAGTKMNATVGVKYYFIQNMKMDNFQSKELNRFFETIIFAQKISTEPNSSIEQPQSKSDYKAEVTTTKQNVKINLGKGLTSIADLYANKNKYAGNVITVKGVVTKYNAEIMGKNWIHLQDGTEKDGHFDLVLTTLVKASLGDTLILSGKLILDKDYGYGYKYDVLLEDAVKK